MAGKSISSPGSPDLTSYLLKVCTGVETLAVLSAQPDVAGLAYCMERGEDADTGVALDRYEPTVYRKRPSSILLTMQQVTSTVIVCTTLPRIGCKPASYLVHGSGSPHPQGRHPASSFLAECGRQLYTNMPDVEASCPLRRGSGAPIGWTAPAGRTWKVIRWCEASTQVRTTGERRSRWKWTRRHPSAL